MRRSARVKRSHEDAVRIQAEIERGGKPTLPCAICDSDIPADATACPWCKGNPAAETVACPARCDAGRVATVAHDALYSDWAWCERCNGEGSIEAPYAHLRAAAKEAA